MYLLAGSIVTNVFVRLLLLLGRSVDDDDNDYDEMLMVCIVGRVFCHQVGRVYCYQFVQSDMVGCLID